MAVHGLDGTFIRKICKNISPGNSLHTVAMQLQQQLVQFYKRCSRTPGGTMRSPVTQSKIQKSKFLDPLASVSCD